MPFTKHSNKHHEYLDRTPLNRTLRREISSHLTLHQTAPVFAVTINLAELNRSRTSPPQSLFAIDQ